MVLVLMMQVAAQVPSHHNEAIDQYDVTQDAAPTGATRPKTRLQSGVRKEKVYTDGTVKWGYFSSIGEPQFLNEAFTNKN